MDDYSNYDGVALADLVARKQVTPAELVEAAIARVERHNPSFGENTEHLLIAHEIAEIERDILEDPGDLERFLVRVR